ncbi:hypothetical protein SELMODRAFT_116842 [Selaginella moellendorffii]|uniref:Pentacotripeptide-repeat region of PRORP domain-containing protein n=1 Tax=Selaginella moellendorffii TaxID=88036 RepID=D8SGQ6_SELML|nr:hypothetical protein SELMODRAFT_116842 [Selaginella moellendorffii]
MKGLDPSSRLPQVFRRFLCVAAHRSLEQTLDLVVSSSSSSCSSWTSALSSSYAELLRRCGRARALEDGRRVHAHIVSTGQSQNPFLGNLLVQMYGKCGSLGEARRAFDGIPESKRNVYSWGLMISAYAQSGHHKQAIDLFQTMQETKTMVVKADCVILASVLGSCAASGDLQTGKAIHEKISSGCLDSNLVVETALLDMYAKCGKVAEARGTFDRMKERDVISWNAMLAAYAQTGHNTHAINLYHGMCCEGVFPDEFTFSTIVTSCSSLRLLNLVHAVIVESGMQHDDGIYCGLIKSYAKLNQIEESERIFRDPVYWNALIAAHGLYGHTPRVLRLFSAMQLEGLAPDEVTFTSVLATCGRSRVARCGRGVFQAMISDYGMRPSLAHYRCLIHLFGRGGHLGAAKELIESMEYEPGDVEWTSLLGFCRLHGGLANVKLGREAAIRALEINPENETAYVLLLNLNAAVHRLEDAKRRWRRRVMENRRRPRYLWRWMREPTWRSLLQGHPHERRMSQRRRHAFIEKLDWRAGVKGRRRQQLQLSNKLPAKTLARMHAFKDYLSPDAWTG